ncbi:uncharacterized protein [Rutidosis leptorrhynchoides]|uniref:uncharacterized protein n=1 Tax=Rutidosis leptorrhynchoides TaxID=125765 RepID=UPI003A995158
MGSIVFVVNDATVHDFYLAIKRDWTGKSEETIIVNVYCPYSDSKKKVFWDALEELMKYHVSSWVICGDFNEVRDQSERQNCVFHEQRTNMFNEFIENMKLIEIPLHGRKFTRISDNLVKLSKLDHFLVSDEFLRLLDDISVTALDRNTSDHCPNLLNDKSEDFGPKPFKLFDIWLDDKVAKKIIIDAWNVQVEGNRKDCVFQNKLKNVKDALRKRSKIKYGSIDIEIENAKKDALEWEKKAEESNLSSGERVEWVKSRNNLLQKYRVKAQMLKQKSRLKWAAEGDDNTRFFHSTI